VSDTATAPHVVAIVGNDIATDSRVRKAAATAAAAGYRSTIVCYSPSRDFETSLEAVRVVKVAVPFEVRAGLSRLRAPLRPFAATELAARHAATSVPQLARRRRLEAAALAGTGRSTTVRLRLLDVRIKVARQLFRVRRRLHVTVDRGHRRAAQIERKIRLRRHGRYADPVSNMLDYELTFGPVIETLRPDIIHAHDVHMIGVAVTAARRLRAAGIDTKVLYDAHELVSGLSYPPRTIAGYVAEESEYIGQVDAVIGVSPEQVELIARKYGLRSPLPVVFNAPVAEFTESDGPTVREAIGAPDAPLLVYHGNLAKERGVFTLVEAMAYLDQAVHLVFVSPPTHPLAAELLDRAKQIGVDTRVHFHGFVASATLHRFLSGADLAVIPYERTPNTDIALPNKLFEALQAGLPILASDMRSLTTFLAARGVGATFTAGSPSDLAAVATTMLEQRDRYTAHLTDDLRHDVSWQRQAETLASVYRSLVPTLAPADGPSELRIVTAQACREILPDDDTAAPVTRLAVGPRNSAGQAFEIAGAVQRVLGIPAVSFSVERNRFGFPVHQQITTEMWRDPVWQLRQQRELADNFTHLLTESGTGLLGALNGGFVDEQLALHREAGQRVAVLFHGSEIRDPQRHARRPHSPYATDDELIGQLRTAHARLRRHLEGLDVPMYVTTPDLLEDVDATWLPVVVDVDSWSAVPSRSVDGVPTVLHLPSSSVLKGSSYADDALFRLDEAGVIRYLRPDSAVRADEMQTLVEDADIVVDGLVIGAYGVTTCQALAAGRLVIGNTSELGGLRNECPVVHSDPDTVEAAVRSLLDRRDEWAAIAERGRSFARRYHDGSFTAHQLGDFLAT
jgi:glycosyltransferase involved in cell wall biosynthesis